MFYDAVDCTPEPIRDSRDSMDIAIEQIKIALLSEYDRLGKVDVAAWVGRYPELRDEIIDFWLWVTGTPLGVEMETGPFEVMDGDVAEDAFRDACLSVNLGRQWLEPPLDPSARAVREMAVALATLRVEPHVKKGKAPLPFRKAIVWSWVVSILQDHRPRVSRLTAQKATYFLECAMNLEIFVAHGRKPLGPYDHKARYKDAEPIAIKKGWLDVQGATLRAADDLTEVRRFVGRYVRSQVLAEKLVSYLARFSDDELETMATVHWCAKELIKTGHAVASGAVMEWLGQATEWRSKLDRPNFSSDRVGAALQRLNDLRLVPPY